MLLGNKPQRRLTNYTSKNWHHSIVLFNINCWPFTFHNTEHVRVRRVSMIPQRCNASYAWRSERTE